MLSRQSTIFGIFFYFTKCSNHWQNQKSLSDPTSYLYYIYNQHLTSIIYIIKNNLNSCLSSQIDPSLSKMILQFCNHASNLALSTVNNHKLKYFSNFSKLFITVGSLLVTLCKVFNKSFTLGNGFLFC